METAKKPGLFAPIIVLVSICLVVSALLAGVFQLTSPIIQRRAEETAGAARAVVLPGGKTFTQHEGTLVAGVLDAYTEDNGAGIVCTTGVSGFNGAVKLMVGVSSEGKVTGIEVMEHTETPGVGTNALTPEYLAKFTGLDSAEGVDVHSGATFTSRAVKGGVDAAIQQLAVIGGAEYVPPVEYTEEQLIDMAITAFVAPAGDYKELTEIELQEDVLKVYTGDEGAGYAMLVQGVGHYPEDPFRMVVAIDAEGAVKGISVVYQNETKGFGYEVLEEDTYLNQFLGAKEITRKSNGDGTKIDTVSSATETSVGAYNAVKAALNQYAAMQ